MRKIGLIAGSGQFPIIFAKSLLSRQYSIYIAAYSGEANPELVNNSEKLEWMYPGQVSRLIRFFTKHRISRAVMLGAIKKTKLFRNIKPDIKALSIIAQVKTTHDDAIMSAFAKTLKTAGINIESPSSLMPELLATKGIWTNRKPSSSEQENIKIGLNIAREIGKMDIGQSVVVGGKTVLAVEAIDGTDATIKRGGRLYSKKAVLVKVCKPNQDRRFDIPAVGLKTVENMHQYNITALAIESNGTIVFDRTEMIKKANKCNISLVSL